jgi:hypothetical protein
MYLSFASKLSFLALFCLILTVGCTLPIATPTMPPTLTTIPTATLTPTIVSTPTVTPTPTPTVAPTVTPFPQALLGQNAILYSGPGNQGYDVLAQFKAGTSLGALGTFGDFVKVQTEVNGKKVEGFVLRNALGSIPTGVPELQVLQVPWQSVPIQNNFISDHTIFQGNQFIVANTTDGYYDPEGVGIQLNGPFMLTMKLQVANASFGSVKVLGILEPSIGTWWQGIRRMDVFLDHGNLGLGFRDGTSEGFKSSTYLPINNDQVLTLAFQDSQGRVFTVLDQDQRVVKTIDVTAMPGL